MLRFYVKNIYFVQENFIAMKEQQPIQSKQLLYHFLQKQNAERDVYHDLMPFKVKEILLKEFSSSLVLHETSSYQLKKSWNKLTSTQNGINIVKTFNDTSKIKYVVTYYETYVQAGAGSFVDQVASFTDYGAAIKTKLIKEITPVIPIPAAVWLFGTAMLGLFGFKRRQTKV